MLGTSTGPQRASSRWTTPPLHVVTHSMGGLLARSYLTRHRPAALGRVVMLGPPNGGSEVADLLVRTALYRRMFGPAGAQLTTGAGTPCARLWDRWTIHWA